MVGDAHGCAQELEDLLHKLNLSSTDALFSVGDIVGKGPECRRTLRRFRELGAVVVRGNHDDAALAYRAFRAGLRETPPKLSEDVAEQYDDFDPEDWAFLEATQFVRRLGEQAHPAQRMATRPVLIVHAGIVPGVSLTDQKAHHLMTMRSIRNDGTVSKRVDDGKPWASLWPGPEHIVFGHDAIRGLQHHAFATGIDSGCVYGRRLSAWVTPYPFAADDGNEAHAAIAQATVVSVPARRAYVQVA